MKNRTIHTLALAVFSLGALFAQDITGTWQGTLVLPNKQELRIVFKISKADSGLKATMYSIDQSPQGLTADAALTGSTVKITIPAIAVTYEGKLDSDGVTLTGNFTQGGAQPIALNLKHAGPKEPEWSMEDAPKLPKNMAADADPEFDACSIKPSKPGQQGRGITVRGREIVTINTPVSFLISFVYGVSAQQVTGGPAWMDNENYDLDGKPTQEGMPNQKQMKIMIQKLLADRFQLKFHREKRELNVYAIQVGKNGPKLTKSAADPKGLPGLGFRALGALNAFNATMSDLAATFQTTVLDRPVVDQTGLEDHYDFQLNWTPDETQFAGLGIRVPPPSDRPDAPPDLGAALQQQLGLKLAATKAPVDVLVIDHIEKPSAN
ncbi:MAG TPA: TIGR03435 family protein [Bryobacteraceae bacterium]|nr:TIGR03435 family protein [Bryobacteraceae bacterium]